MSHASTSLSTSLACLAAVFALAGPAAATQHLVRAGEAWDLFQGRLKPGDEIILMSGRHRPCWLHDVRGTADRPIVIRGLDPDDPPIIEAARFGIRIDRPAHVRIRDLRIQGATIHGIYLNGLPEEEAGERADDEALEEPGPREFTGNVILTNVTITDTGPDPARHAICARNIERFHLDSCRIEGWGGSGLEMIGVEDARVKDTTFIGKDGYEQLSGVRVRAGSDRVHIDRCRFEKTGDQGISIGAGSKLDEFMPPLTEEMRPGSRYEASRVRIRRCVFVGGHCAIAFVNCERSVVRNCTIVRPTRAVLSIRNEQEDARFGAVRQCDFGSNLITWMEGDVSALTHLGNGATFESINLEQNLWWTPNWQDVREALGPFPGIAQFPQLTDVDPLVDEQLRPRAQAAAVFGAHAP